VTALPESARNILVVRADRVGDTICTVPAIRAIRRYCPRARVTGLLAKQGIELLRGTALLDELVAWPAAGIRARAAVARDLRAGRFDAVCVFSPLDGLYLPALWTGAPVRAGVVVGSRPLTRLLAACCLTHVLSLDQERRLRRGTPLLHEVLKGIELLRLLGVAPGDDPDLALGLPAAVVDEAARRVSSLGAFRHVVAVPHCRRYAAAGWTASDLARLVRALHRELPGTAILVTYGDEEQADGARLRGELAGLDRVAVWGDLPLQLWLAILGRVSLVVSIDSAAVHGAAAARVPCVALYGAPHVSWKMQEWRPWKVPHRQVEIGRGGTPLPEITDAAAELLDRPRPS
jgi:ADP-heptose:LPS heptosyltransferase